MVNLEARVATVTETSKTRATAASGSSIRSGRAST